MHSWWIQLAIAPIPPPSPLASGFAASHSEDNDGDKLVDQTSTRDGEEVKIQTWRNVGRSLVHIPCCKAASPGSVPPSRSFHDGLGSKPTRGEGGEEEKEREEKTPPPPWTTPPVLSFFSKPPIAPI
jgi:hypothetical protein